MNVIFPVKIKLVVILVLELLMLIIYSLFDVRVDMILIANKNKTSYDALLVDMLFISSCNGDNCDFNWMWDMFYAVINFWVSIKGCDFDLCWEIKKFDFAVISCNFWNWVLWFVRWNFFTICVIFGQVREKIWFIRVWEIFVVE